jgi:hypothetical protein
MLFNVNDHVRVQKRGGNSNRYISREFIGIVSDVLPDNKYKIKWQPGLDRQQGPQMFINNIADEDELNLV